MAEKNIFIGRQPILDGDGEIEAYELLFRDGQKGYAEVSDNQGATARVLANALNQFGIKQLTENARSFINIDETILFSDFVTSIPKENFVLELLETTKVTKELVDKVAKLNDEGYTFAIDDYTGEYKALFAPVIEYVSIVKLEIPAIELDNIKSEVDDILEANPNVRILAEKIEDKETFIKCKEAGCTLFQGYFFAKPTIIKGKSIDPSSMAVLQLFNALNGDVETDKIIALFDKNPKLMFNLFKYLNSSKVSLDNDVSTIKTALSLLGREALRNWVALLMFSGINDEGFPEPTFDIALNRSLLMKVLAGRLWGEGNQELIDTAGLIGILSLMDAMLSVPLAQILSEINVSEEIRIALLEHKGNLGRLLYLVKFAEKPDIDLMEQVADKLNMDVQELMDLKLKAYGNQ